MINELIAAVLAIAAIMFLTRKQLRKEPTGPIYHGPALNFVYCNTCGALKPLGMDLALWEIGHASLCPGNCKHGCVVE